MNGCNPRSSKKIKCCNGGIAGGDMDTRCAAEKWRMGEALCVMNEQIAIESVVPGLLVPFQKQD
jgi:hypothetical protein